MCSMFHALEMTLPSSYWILYVLGRSTSWMMNGPSQGGDNLFLSLLPWTRQSTRSLTWNSRGCTLRSW
jgi:hypothetical protein